MDLFSETFLPSLFGLLRADSEESRQAAKTKMDTALKVGVNTPIMKFPYVTVYHGHLFRTQQSANRVRASFHAVLNMRMPYAWQDMHAIRLLAATSSGSRLCAPCRSNWNHVCQAPIFVGMHEDHSSLDTDDCCVKPSLGPLYSCLHLEFAEPGQVC